jgi:hypothetical protein
MNQNNIFFQQSGWRETMQGGGGGVLYCLLCFQGSGVLGVFRFLR